MSVEKELEARESSHRTKDPSPATPGIATNEKEVGLDSRLDHRRIGTVAERERSLAQLSERIDRIVASEMPSVDSGSWSDSDVAEPVRALESGTTVESLQAKKARVENIISTMQHTTPPPSLLTNGKESDSQRRKRKQYQPQPQRGEDEGAPETKRKPVISGNRREERRHLQSLLSHLQTQLDALQERYQDLYDPEEAAAHSDSGDSADLDDLKEPLDTSQAIRKSELINGKTKTSHHEAAERGAGMIITHDKAKKLRGYLKSRLSEALNTAVDSVVDSIVVSPPSLRVEEPPRLPPTHHHAKSPSPGVPIPSGPGSHGSQGSSNHSVYSHPQRSPVTEQTEALSLVVPSRKAPSPASFRSHNNNNNLISKSPPSSLPLHIPASKPLGLATSVAIPNPSLHHHPFARTFLPAFPNGYDHLDDLRFVGSPLLGFPGLTSQLGSVMMNESSHHSHHSPSPRRTPPSISESYSSFKSDGSDSSPPMAPPDLSEYSGISGTNFTLTLTPTHLRKAKLMFFFCRYPSSAILRQYFPDVKFNRHNTSQMIKWFSNFREFFYIQMEKFSRQSLSGGVADAESLEVTRDSELFRALNLHYNKSNEYRAPDSFLTVATTTLREFFIAIKNGRDSEASWKKSIYKVISKLDEPIPSFFRSSNCLELLQV